jgi:hypothetical protein
MSDLRVKPLKVLVVSGGHPFELEPFLAMFSANPDIDFTHVQPPEAREWFRASHVGEWDAIVCYDMQGFILRDPELLESAEPSAEPVNYAEGVKFEEPPAEYAEGLIAMLEAGQGVVFLHHAMSAWPSWPLWAEIVGGRWHYLPAELHGRQWPSSGYTKEVSHRITPIDPNHPICAGLEEGFEIVDEIYLNPIFEDQIVPLLRSDFEMKSKNFYSGELSVQGRLYESDGWTHPDGSGIVGWVKTAGSSPIVYLQSGHGPAAYANPGFRRLLANSIRWVASPEAHQWATEHPTSLRT